MRILRDKSALSLIELLISLSIMAAVTSILSGLLIGTLQSQRFSSRQEELLQMARLAMERIVTHTKQANRILLPLENNPTRDVLALGGYVDNDGDGRYDEDPPADSTNDGMPGISGIDDDGDGNIDEGSSGDDDEDGVVDEDPVNGVDDDGDGAVDEDPPRDLNNDGQPGIARVDDNGDGVVDNAARQDDDEDGLLDEDPIEALVYYLDSVTKTLWERYPINATTSTTTILAEQVETFQVQRLTGLNGVALIDILLRLRDQDGHVIELETRVTPRNVTP